MLPFCSIRLLSSRSLSKFSIQSNPISTNFACHKPFTTIFLRHLTMKTQNAYSGVTSVHELAKGIVHLQCESSAEGGVCDVYVVGTCHVFEESCREVKAVINYLKPQVVFLELCKRRAGIFTNQDYEVLTISEMLHAWKNKKVNPVWMFSAWMQTKTAKELKVLPGAEFKVAYEEARSYGARVHLGDRPLDITMRRTWNKITMWQMIKFLYIFFKSGSSESIAEQIAKEEGLGDGYTQKDILQIVVNEIEEDMDGFIAELQYISKALPAVETFLFERDRYMSHELWKVAREHSSVVAVVGKIHVSGIKKNWMQPVDVQSLLEVPPEKNYFGKVKKFVSIGALTGVVVASGLYLWSIQ